MWPALEGCGWTGTRIHVGLGRVSITNPASQDVSLWQSENCCSGNRVVETNSANGLGRCRNAEAEICVVSDFIFPICRVLSVDTSITDGERAYGIFSLV